MVEPLCESVCSSQPTVGCVAVGGGIISWLVAASRPDMVDRLIVMAAPHIGLAQINQSVSQALKSWYIAFFQVRLCPFDNDDPFEMNGSCFYG